MAVVDVKTSAIKAWVAKMAADEVGAPTIENAFGLLRQVMGAALEDNRIARNPYDGVRLPKRQHADRGYLTHAQVSALADAVDRQPEAVRLLAYTGLRWGEMAALRVCDFDMLRRRVNVSRSVTESGGLVWSTPKTWERRSVPFPASIADELAVLMVGRGRDDLVFTDMRGGVLRNSNWRARVFEPAVRKCHKVRRVVPVDHSARPSAHGGESGRERGGQREGCAADAGACEGQHDAGCIRRPLRRRPGRRGCEPGRRNSSRCRRGPRGCDPVSLPVTAVWAAMWPPPVGSARSAAG